MRQIILAINALLKFKAYTLINVLGLACSLACVLTVARYIHQENTVNQCFPEYKRICLIKTSTSSGENFLGGYRSGSCRRTIYGDLSNIGYARSVR